MMQKSRAELEKQLDAFDSGLRLQALDVLLGMAGEGDIALPPPGKHFNLHCHSFFSFNGYGYSPSGLAWRGRTQGLCAMALVDFDVLDGVDEFLEACSRLGLRCGAGLETRVFIPEFAEHEINSPGEPGIAYQIGLGFVSGQVRNAALLRRLEEMAQRRTREIADKVNTLLAEIALDYEADVAPLTPNGHPTERHVCLAYDQKARGRYPGSSELARYWSDRLHITESDAARSLADPPVFQGVIRAKTMKSGGVGYVSPRATDFPLLQEFNRFVLENGALPVFAFLDGGSSGEMRMEELLDLMQDAGVGAVNIIPDRNWNIADPGTREIKVARLDAFIETATRRSLPVIVGTEMNAFGQRFVDDFEAPELKKHYKTFRDGAYCLHGHTLLQRVAGMGYGSEWSKSRFTDTAARNRFYVALGEKAVPAVFPAFIRARPAMSPEEILGIM